MTVLSLIYNIKLVKLKILKTYIEINLANSFTKLSKSSKKILIFFCEKIWKKCLTVSKLLTSKQFDYSKSIFAAINWQVFKFPKKS